MPGGRPLGRTEIASKVRKGFWKAIENLKKGGTITDIADIWEEMIAQDPFKAFDTIAKFIPKEHLIEETHTHRLIVGVAMDLDEWEKKHLTHDSPPAQIERSH